MTVSSARTLKGPRRFVRRVAHRANSPQWQFLRGFLKNPVMVGSVIPSSKVLIDRMLGPVRWDEVKLFIEYGPGVGTFTRPVLERLPADAKLIAIDTNADFIDYLRKDIDDDRLIAVAGSAADVRQIIEARASTMPTTSCPDCLSRPCRPASARRSARRRPTSSGPAAPSSSISSAPRSATSSPRISSELTAASNGSTCHRRPCSGPGASRKPKRRNSRTRRRS